MTKPHFTVAMASHLGQYKNAASNRDYKIRRAIDSVLGDQTFRDFELQIVADGCDKTVEIVFANYGHLPQIGLTKIPRQPLWSGRPRNTALSKGNGLYAVYLDVDDYFGRDHLRIIADQIGDAPWVWFNDLLGSPDKTFTERECYIDQFGQHGTSNICHLKDMVRWPDRGDYSHDHQLITKLRKVATGKRIETPQYHVCHLPPNNIFHTVDI